ncbi:hypothetical protein CRE_17488 [Caenorhabditis remanei]|uniref:Uncharacterized protein n=1 Tax=Caenorhabditis remanei TaxID=31234 RepID=E3N7V1_CAERE|nr:hypothetical protein CRE_17488 [Caenorhabditis remanei]
MFDHILEVASLTDVDLEDLSLEALPTRCEENEVVGNTKSDAQASSSHSSGTISPLQAQDSTEEEAKDQILDPTVFSTRVFKNLNRVILLQQESARADI